MDLGLRAGPSAERVDEAAASLTMVPNVISPTSAFGGNKLKLTTSVSLSALRSSSSRHVSTTMRKMGGICAGRESVYSMVVYLGSSSAGRLVVLMSL